MAYTTKSFEIVESFAENTAINSSDTHQETYRQRFFITLVEVDNNIELTSVFTWNFIFYFVSKTIISLHILFHV